MIRNQFTFYRSFWIAAKSLPKKDRLSFFEAIFAFIFEQTPADLTGGAAAVFSVVQPVLEASNRKAEAGKLGGSTPKASGKQDESKNKDKDKDKDKNKDKDKIKDKCPPPHIPPEGGTARRSRPRRRGENVFAEMLREEGLLE